MNICCYAWYIPLLTKSPGCGGAVTPVASEVIYLLLGYYIYPPELSLTYKTKTFENL